MYVYVYICIYTSMKSGRENKKSEHTIHMCIHIYKYIYCYVDTNFSPPFFWYRFPRLSFGAFQRQILFFQTLFLKQAQQTFSLSVSRANSFFCFSFFGTGSTDSLLERFKGKFSLQDICAAIAPWSNELQCVAVCCNVLQYVAVCCSVFLVVYCSVLQCVAVCCSVLQCVAVCCSVAAVCCSVLVCVAVCCSVLRLVYRDHLPLWGQNWARTLFRKLRSRLRFNTLHHAATHCNTLPHSATQCNTLQHTATHWIRRWHGRGYRETDCIVLSIFLWGVYN